MVHGKREDEDVYETSGPAKSGTDEEIYLLLSTLIRMTCRRYGVEEMEVIYDELPYLLLGLIK